MCDFHLKPNCPFALKLALVSERAALKRDFLLDDNNFPKFVRFFTSIDVKF